MRYRTITRQQLYNVDVTIVHLHIIIITRT